MSGWGQTRSCGHVGSNVRFARKRRSVNCARKIPIWTTPYELTKSKKGTKRDKRRRYETPLPPLAQRIFKGIPKRHPTLVFPGLRIHYSIADRPTLDGHAIRRQLINNGAPKDFAFHTMRHTLATWLQEQKYSEWACGLVLNHSGSGSVTERYSHGRFGPLEVKLEMLTAWANHVEGLVQPKGARVLR
jgi:integrase